MGINIFNNRYNQINSFIRSFNLRKREDYNLKIKISIISSLILLILPFLPIWQWSFSFNAIERVYFDTNSLLSAFNIIGYYWEWVLLILIGALGIILLLIVSPKDEKNVSSTYRNLIFYLLFFILIGLLVGMLMTHGLWGLTHMLLAPGLWISLFLVIIIAINHVETKTWEKMRRDSLAYVLVFPTVFLMLFVFYIPIFLNLFWSFQDFYTEQLARFRLETIAVNSVGFRNYLTILAPEAQLNLETFELLSKRPISFDLLFTILIIVVTLSIIIYLFNGKWSVKKKSIFGGTLLFSLTILIAFYQMIDISRIKEDFILDGDYLFLFGDYLVELSDGGIDFILVIGMLFITVVWVLISIITALSINNTFKKLLIAILTLIPLIAMFVLSNIFLELYRTITGENIFYISSLDPAPLRVLMNTFYWTFTCVAAHILIGLMLALLMNHNFRLRSWVRGFLIVPWAVPTFITITILGFFVIWENTAADSIFQIFHFIPHDWYGTKNFLTSAIIVNIYLGYSFIMVAILAALQAVNQEMYEAAEMDGASSFHRFRYITFPMIKPVIVVTSILGFMWTFNMFNVIFLLARPKNELLRPEDYVILIVYVFNLFSTGQNWSYASTISILLFILLIIMTKAYTKITGKGPYDLD